jgi:hypothetical protein
MFATKIPIPKKITSKGTVQCCILIKLEDEKGTESTSKLIAIREKNIKTNW